MAIYNLFLQIYFTSVSSKSLPQDNTSPDTQNVATQNDVQPTDTIESVDASTDVSSESSNGITDTPLLSSVNNTSESSDSNTVIPDLPSSSTEESVSSISSTEGVTPNPPKKTPPKRRPYHDCFGLSIISNDYDSFLDFVNQTSQKKLEILDTTLTALEKEIRPGTPLMKIFDWILNLFNNNQRTPSKGNDNQEQKKSRIKVTLPEVSEVPET